MDLKPFVRDVPDFPKPGIMFRDITPLLARPAALDHVIQEIGMFCHSVKAEALVAIESRGFLIGSPVAHAERLPLIPVRKPGKLPMKTISAKYGLEYGKDELHMHDDPITLQCLAGKRVVVVDDVLATGGTMLAAFELVKQQQGIVVGSAFLLELSALKGREKLKDSSVFTCLTY
jgi:adenine phosphoribosyltransferase